MISLNNNTAQPINNFAKTEQMEDGKEYIEFEVTDENGNVEILYLDIHQAGGLINEMRTTINLLMQENFDLNVGLDEAEGELEFLREIWMNQDTRLN